MKTLEERNEAKENKKYLSRVRTPRTLVIPESIDAMTIQYGALLGQVMRDICIYVCRCKNRDLFGNAVFSIDDFVKEFGYRRNVIRGKAVHLEGNYFNGEVLNEKRIECDSLLDLAVYLGTKEVFSVRNKEKVQEEGKIITRIYNRSYMMLSGDAKVEGKAHKKVYYLQLGPGFAEEYFNRYLKINYNDYLKIGEGKYKKINSVIFYKRYYMILCYYKSFCKGIYETTVDRVAADMKIAITEARKKKVEIKEILEALSKTLEEEPFFFEFYKEPKERYEYRIRFIFPRERTLALENRQEVMPRCEIFLGKLWESFQADFYMDYRQKLEGGKTLGQIELFNRLDKDRKDKTYLTKEGVLNPFLFQNCFAEWFFSEKDAEKKKQEYRACFHRVYNIEYPENEKMYFDEKNLDMIYEKQEEKRRLEQEALRIKRN